MHVRRFEQSINKIKMLKQQNESLSHLTRNTYI